MEVDMSEETAQPFDFERDPEWDNLDKSTDMLNNYWTEKPEGEVNPEQAPQEQPEQSIEEDKFDSIGDATRLVAETALQPVLGVADFASDVVGLVPWLKPIDDWWDENSYRSTHPGHTLLRDASSIIIPTLYGGTLVTGAGKAMVAAKSITLPRYAHTLGKVAAYAGVDTGVAMISSHSKTDDNMSAVLNDWLGWDIPWATRASDSPDVRWKKNVFEAAGFGAGVELLGAAFSFARKTKFIPKDEAADAAIRAKNAAAEQYDNPLSETVERSIAAREAAQNDEMVRALQNDPDGTVYNAFVNDLGPDDAGRAVINTQPDPLMAKVNHTQIQNNIDTLNGRAAPVVDEAFNENLTKAIKGNDRAKLLSNVFERINPKFDAVVDGKTITNAELERGVANLTNSVFGNDISLKDFSTVVEDMKSIVYDNSLLVGQNLKIASRAFQRLYENLFDPNLRQASALIAQQAADNIADTASAIRLIGDSGDPRRQLGIMFDKLNLLGQEVKVNNWLANKVREFKRIRNTGDVDTVVSWMENQTPEFDKYLKNIKQQGTQLNKELSAIARENPHYYKAFVEAYDSSNGKIDTLMKLHEVTRNNIGVLKKGIIDLQPRVPSMLIKQLHAARINSMLGGLAPVRALTGNSMMTAIKPISVFAGAYLQGNTELAKRSLYTYGGIIENFKRGLKVMSDEWQFAKNFPEEAALRGRADLRQAKLEQLEYMDSMAEGWKLGRERGDKGRAAMWNLTKGVSWWNKQPIVRWGVNALYAIDGMTNSFMASGVARAKAHDELFHKFGGSFSDDAFRTLQRDIYDQMFDSKGLLTDEAARYASQEIALNLDSTVVDKLESFIEMVPAARGLFLFPKTGVNAFQLAWTFNPLSSLGLALPKAKRVMQAVTADEKIASLMEHGIKDSINTEMAYQALRSEYIGRQIMGSTVVMGAGIWALNGNMTGHGPQDGAERQRMMRMGWQPQSIKNPITGEWRSYAGFEPFASLMSLTSDIIYQANRVDQAFTEDMFRKAVFAISMNVTNDTFVSGFQPLASLLSGEPHAWSKFFAQTVDQTVPLKGVRSILNNAISPQLRDVNNDFFGYLANGNKFLFPGNQDSYLPNLLDVYTGKPIRGYESITQAANALMPFFKQNSDMEPWRLWILSTGWDGLQKQRINKYTKQPLSTQDRHFINNWIAENAGLEAQMIKLMTENDGFWQKKMQEYHKRRGWKSQAEFPVKEWLVHRVLDDIHDRAFEGAWNALEAYNSQFTTQGRNLRMRNHELNQGHSGSALETQQRIQKLQQMPR